MLASKIAGKKQACLGEDVHLGNGNCYIENSKLMEIPKLMMDLLLVALALASVVSVGLLIFASDY